LTNHKYILYFFLFVWSFSSNGQTKESSPEQGSLLIMGGLCTNDYFLSEFSSLSGGLESRIVLIPSAMEDNLLDSESDITRIKQPFVDLGFTNIKILHTRSREAANSDSLNALILGADGVWITGGRQWRLAKTYGGTEIVNSLKTIYSQGKVIAGTSAGASIMGSVLVRGDSLSNTIMLGSYQTGFGLMEACAIDQHHLARNRQFDLFEVKRLRPELLGIGIDENTGIVVSNDKFKVIGFGYVSIYDGTRWSAERDTIYQLGQNEEQFYLLEANLEYDILKGKVIFPEDRSKRNCAESLLFSLVGIYQQTEALSLGNDLRIKVTVEEGKLYFLQSWNKAKYEVHYHHALTFFRPKANAVFYFEKDKFDAINSFHYYQDGSSEWRKM
jgi:cyanophycinase